MLVATAGASRAATLVAWTRARLQTHLFGLTIADADDLSPHEPGKAAAVRTAGADLAAAQQAVAHAEAAARRQLDRTQTSARRLRISQVIPFEHLRHLEQAVEIRTSRLAVELLTHPAPWMHDDIAERLTALDTSNAPIAPARLAAGYGAVATTADRAGIDPHDLSLDEARYLAAGSHDLVDALSDLGWDRIDPVEPTILPEQVGNYLSR